MPTEKQFLEDKAFKAGLLSTKSRKHIYSISDRGRC